VKRVDRDGHGHDEDQDARRRIAIEAQPEGDPRPQEVPLAIAAQRAQQKPHGRGHEQRVKREAQSDAADDVGPGGDAGQKERQQADSSVVQIPPEQIDERSVGQL
jgi:hypothetical protein